MVRTQKGLVGWVRATDINTDHQGKDLFREKEGSSSTWSARTADGRAFNGTWNVAPNSTPKAASGGWTLSDASGATVMRGSWSADKHETGWNGVWSATLEGGKGEYDARLMDRWQRFWKLVDSRRQTVKRRLSRHPLG